MTMIFPATWRMMFLAITLRRLIFLRSEDVDVLEDDDLDDLEYANIYDYYYDDALDDYLEDDYLERSWVLVLVEGRKQG